MEQIPYVEVSDIFDKIINEGIPLVKVKGTRYDLVYARCKYNGVSVVRCIPKDNNLLFEVGGTYVKSKPLTYRCFLAGSAKEAKERYKSLYGWNATKCRCIPPGIEAEDILTNPLKMPL